MFRRSPGSAEGKNSVDKKMSPKNMFIPVDLSATVQRHR